MLRFFKRNNTNKTTEKSSLIAELLDKFEDALEVSYGDRNAKLKDHPTWQEIQNYEKQTREEIALLALSRLIDKTDRKYNHGVVRRKIFKTEFNVKTPPSKESLLRLFEILQQNNLSLSYRLPPNDILFSFKYYKEQYGKDALYMKARNYLVTTYNESYGDATLKKIVLGLGKLDHDANDDSIFDRRDVLGQHLERKWEAYDDQFKKVIKTLLESGSKIKANQQMEQNFTGAH